MSAESLAGRTAGRRRAPELCRRMESECHTPNLAERAPAALPIDTHRILTPRRRWDGPITARQSRQAGEKTVMKNLIARFIREEEGQDIIEYALLAGFISVSGYLILQSIGTDVNTLYTKVQTATGTAAS